MSSPTATTNPAGDFEETVLRYAKHLGRDKYRRAAFRLIYGRGSKPRSKKQIAEALGVGGEAQVVQNALEHLAKHHLIKRLPNEGQVSDGSRVVYAKEEFPRANRVVIERYADDPAAAKKVATKRTQQSPVVFSLVRQVRQRKGPRNVGRAVPAGKATLRIAVLVTNPNPANLLQTGREYREIEEGILLAQRGELIDLRPLIAPDFDRLVDMLNTYKPNVIHFSGHGGGGGLLFDGERGSGGTGTVLDFDSVAQVIEATDATPTLLVLAACDTVTGAERFLDAVPAVIAMADSIEDKAALAFSARLYRSFASGATLAKAVQQAKLGMAVKKLKDAQLPTLLTREPADADRTLL